MAALHRTVAGPVASEASEVPEPPAGFRSRRRAITNLQVILGTVRRSLCQAPGSKINDHTSLGLQAFGASSLGHGPSHCHGHRHGHPGRMHLWTREEGRNSCVLRSCNLLWDRFDEVLDAPPIVTATTRPDEPWQHQCMWELWHRHPRSPATGPCLYQQPQTRVF